MSRKKQDRRLKIPLDTTGKKGLNAYGVLRMLNITDTHLPTRARRAVQVPCETGGRRDREHAPGKEALQCRGQQQGRHLMGDCSQGATCHGRSQGA
jgi:hypothetical protein